MATLTSLPDNVSFMCEDGQSVLEAAQAADIPFASACGGNARCSTCRIWVLEGAASWPMKNQQEAHLTERIALSDPIRLACQVRPTDDLRLPFFNRGGPEDEAHGGSSQFEDGTVVCRWHISTFDLHSGEAVGWGQGLASDGTAPGFEILGDISKNRAPLEVLPAWVEDGDNWVALPD